MNIYCILREDEAQTDGKKLAKEINNIDSQLDATIMVYY